ncbi:ABC transporter substrate-binding protein, partial [Vibrio vulnificus]
SYSHQIQQIISDANLIVPGYMVPYTRVGYWRWLKYPQKAMTKKSEVLFTSGGAIGLGTFWIDKDAKKETEKAIKAGKAFAPVTVIDDTYK